MQSNEFGFNFDHSYARLPQFFFSLAEPVPLPAPQLVMFNGQLAEELGLNADALESSAGAAILSGNRLPEWALPLAQAYAGHQFGHFTMLGDGRAMLLGEQITPQGERWDLQLKGSGRTPYSRGGDGKAVLGPMLREYLISEAMHALGIPTTRSLAVLTTGELVPRETLQPGAVLVRVAKSHLRVGTFQYAASFGTEQDLKKLADYAIKRHYPELAQEENPYLGLLQAVIRAQAGLIAQWMLVGFVHGVMNTDNMTISGETIDYGPCAFLDRYNPAAVFSSIDQGGRYAYGRQPQIAVWNLARFAEALFPLLAPDHGEAERLAQAELDRFFPLYNEFFLNGMRSKLGLRQKEPGDWELVQELLQLMAQFQADYTNTFLDLTFHRFTQGPLHQSEAFTAWQQRWRQRWEQEGQGEQERVELMKASNPAVIPRNHRVEEALQAAVQRDDYQPLHKLLAAVKDPFAHSPEQNEYEEPPDPDSPPYRTFCGT